VIEFDIQFALLFSSFVLQWYMYICVNEVHSIRLYNIDSRTSRHVTKRPKTRSAGTGSKTRCAAACQHIPCAGLCVVPGIY